MPASRDVEADWQSVAGETLTGGRAAGFRPAVDGGVGRLSPDRTVEPISRILV